MPETRRFTTERAKLDLLLGLDQPAAPFARRFVEANFGVPPFNPATDHHGQLAAMATRVYLRATADLDPQAALKIAEPWLAATRATGIEGPALRSCLVATATVARRAGRFDDAIGYLREAQTLSCTAPGGRQVALELATALRRRAGPGDVAEALTLAEAVSEQRRAEYGDATNATVLEADHEVLQALGALGRHDLHRALDLRARRLWRSGFLSRYTAEAFCIVGRCWLERGQPAAALGDATVARLIADHYPLDRALAVTVELLSADTNWALSRTPESTAAERQRQLAAECARRAADTLAFAYGADHPHVQAVRQRAALGSIGDLPRTNPQ